MGHQLTCRLYSETKHEVCGLPRGHEGPHFDHGDGPPPFSSDGPGPFSVKEWERRQHDRMWRVRAPRTPRKGSHKRMTDQDRIDKALATLKRLTGVRKED